MKDFSQPANRRRPTFLDARGASVRKAACRGCCPSTIPRLLSKARPPAPAAAARLEPGERHFTMLLECYILKLLSTISEISLLTVNKPHFTIKLIPRGGNARAKRPQQIFSTINLETRN